MLWCLRKTPSSLTAWALGFITLFGLLMLWPAVFNGYPLVDWDSSAYVDNSIHLTALNRPFPYSGFLLLTSLHRSAWGIVTAQALLVSTIVWFTLTSVFAAGEPFEGVAPLHAVGSGLVSPRQITLPALMMLIACGISSLPYYVSLIMPDVFTLTGILSFFVLLYGRSRFAVAFAFGLLALSASVHGSNAPIFALLGGLWLFWYRRRRLLWAFAAIGLGLLLGASIHILLTGKLYGSRMGQTILFARLVQDGLVPRTLEASCSKRPSAFCPYIELLRGKSSDDYLWGAGSVRFLIDKNRETEERALILRSLELFPLENTRAVWRHFVRGLDQTIEMYWAMPGYTVPFRDRVPSAFPADVKTFNRARQVNQAEWSDWQLRSVFVRLTWVAVVLSMALVAYGIVSYMKRSAYRPKLIGSLVIGMGGGVLFNTLVASAVSSDGYGRYFSRVNGVIFIFAALLIANAIGEVQWRRRPST